MTVVQLQVLLHYRVMACEFPGSNWPPAVTDAVNWLVSNGMLAKAPEGTPAPMYSITDKGSVHVEALKALPLPVQKWVPGTLRQG